MTFLKECPNCNEVISYENKRSWYNALKRDSKCKKCSNIFISNTLSKKHKNGELKIVTYDKKTSIKKYFRNCPVCEKLIGHTTKQKMLNSEKNKTLCNSCSTYIHKKTFKDVLSDDNIKQMRATKAGFVNWEEYVENYPKKQFYKREVWRLTYKQPIQTLENWDKRGRCGVNGAYQLDHIKSIDWGWKNNIPAEEIAKWENLRMLPWKTNLLKSNI